MLLCGDFPAKKGTLLFSANCSSFVRYLGVDDHQPYLTARLRQSRHAPVSTPPAVFALTCVTPAAGLISITAHLRFLSQVVLLLVKATLQ